MAGGPLTYPTSAVADSSGTAQIKIQFGSFAPPSAWVKVNIILDVAGSPSAQLVADSVVLDQAGGPQPQLGPAVFTGSQNVSVVVTGAMPNSTIVAHVNGAWDDDLQALDAVATLSGGTIGAQQLVGTPFLENASLAIAPSATSTSAVFPMLGYSAVYLQFIVTVGALTSMPTVTLNWLDNSTPPVSIFQSNWQAQKEIDIVASWGQNCQLTIVNTDAAHTCNIATTLVPIANPPARKADALTYKQTATNLILGIHNQTAQAHGANTLTATSNNGLGWAGPATLYVNPNDGDPQAGLGNGAFSLQCGPTGTGRVLANYPWYCPIIIESIDLPNQPLTASYTNNGGLDTTPDIAIFAGYR